MNNQYKQHIERTFKVSAFLISIKSQGQSLLPFYGGGYKDLERSINLTIMGQLGDFER